MTTELLIAEMLGPRLDEAAQAWLGSACDEIRSRADSTRFATLLSMASRHIKSTPLAPSDAHRAAAAAALPGWNPERWTLRESARVQLILARPDLAEASGAGALEDAFRFADEGELCALYRSLAHLPNPARFAWRAGEGCRTNMKTVFEAVACDTPYPVAHFDDNAWHQAVIKCIFIESPLWRVFGLDTRLSENLARMALDLAEERRSAGRAVQHELWLCLGGHCGDRARRALELELESGSNRGRAAAAYALARAGHTESLERRLDQETDGRVVAALRDALAGNTSQAAFAGLADENGDF